jgi:cytochrome c peroxidase
VIALAALAVLLGAAAPAGAGGGLLPFEPHEVRRILAHGPWPPPWAPDPSNRASGRPAAVDLGRRLFHDPRLSAGGAVSCASCHDPGRRFTDGRARAVGLAIADRNTPALANVRWARWFGWDGAGDSLWAQSVRPLVDAREMGGDAGRVAALVRGDPDLACRYARVFGAPPGADDERVLVDVGKALAAFQETLVTGPTPFDAFREALRRGDRAAAAAYPLAAQRGLRLFVGRGACAVCHVGPRFTNGEFHDVGVPYFAGPGRVDPGRHAGIRRLRASPFNLLGPHSDDLARATATGTRHVALEPRNWGEFKVPSLRDVARTAPYMHAGSHPTLRDVVRHYSELDPGRVHAHGERVLRPLHLAAAEVDDLVAFLESLTDPAGPDAAPPAPGACR